MRTNGAVTVTGAACRSQRPTKTLAEGQEQ